MHNRNNYLDICKGFAIILTVLGHCIQYGQGSSFLDNLLFFDNPLFIFIYSFHMPLFMIISGFLFSFTISNNDNKTIIKKKFCQLIVPLFFWGCISTAKNALKVLLSDDLVSFRWIIENFIYYFLNGPWFLWAIWWCSLIVIIVKKYFNNSKILYFLIFIITFILPDSNGLKYYKYMYPYFVLAYFFNNLNIYEKKSKIVNNRYIKVAMTLLFCILLCRYNNNYYIYTTGYTVLGKNISFQILNDLFRMIIGFAGSITFLYVGVDIYNLMNDKCKIVLSYIGRCSIGIYLISDYLFIILRRITYTFDGINYLIAIIETILIVASSLIIDCIIKKIKPLNVALLGGR